MEIAKYSEGKVTILDLSGRIDSVTAIELEQQLPALVETTCPVVVDMANTEYVSSAGLRVFLKGAKVARATGHRLLLAGLNASVQEVFDISGFTAIFDIYADRASAISAL